MDMNEKLEKIRERTAAAQKAMNHLHETLPGDIRHVLLTVVFSDNCGVSIEAARRPGKVSADANSIEGETCSRLKSKAKAAGS